MAILSMSVIGADIFDETITDYTGHQLWFVVYNVMAFIIPAYVILNWFVDVYHIIDIQISSVCITIFTYVKEFVCAGIVAVERLRKSDL